jgi:TonB family protein
MTPLPFGQKSKKNTYLRAVAIPLSIFIHGLFAYGLTHAAVEKVKPEDIWLDMVVVEKTEPVEQEPELEPESEPEPEKPKEIQFEDIPVDPVPPPEPPPEEKKEVRRVQGLSANSFSEGSGTNLSVRAGTTLSTKATDEKLSIDDAANSTSISYAAATKQPKLKKRPPLDIPDIIKEEGIEGAVKIKIDIDQNGVVIEAILVSSLHPEADKACLRSWKNAKFQPAEQNGETVLVRGFPRRCRFKALD